MRRMNCWVVCYGLLATFLLILFSVSGLLPLPVAAVVMVGLGANATLLLHEHRRKLGGLLG